MWKRIEIEELYDSRKKEARWLKGKAFMCVIQRYYKLRWY